jgi:hypothetical protein
MSNSFPPPPSGWQLAQVSYQAVLPHPDARPGGPLDFGAGVHGQLAYNTPVLSMVFAFDTPGSFGAFDQAAVESGFAQAITGVCQVLASMSGAALAGLQAQVTVTRSWNWAAGASGVTTADTMAYPPAGTP